jgi:hypothetical protein
MLAKGRRTMARHLIRALSGIALVGATLVLAACTSSGSPGFDGAAQSGSSAAKADGVPVKSGTVTVKEGDKVICTMTVANGKGTCKVSASSVGVGTNAIVGAFSGKGYGPAQSAPINVSVVKVATSVALSMSPARPTYGDEQAARVTVRVTATSAGVPAGSVLVRSGATAICTIALSHGAGSCALGARQLKAGSQSLSAIYGGDKTHYGSASAVEKITVAG